MHVNKFDQVHPEFNVNNQNGNYSSQQSVNNNKNSFQQKPLTKKLHYLIFSLNLYVEFSHT